MSADEGLSLMLDYCPKAVLNMTIPQAFKSGSTHLGIRDLEDESLQIIPEEPAECKRATGRMKVLCKSPLATKEAWLEARIPGILERVAEG